MKGTHPVTQTTTMQEADGLTKKVTTEFKESSSEVLYLCGDIANQVLKGNYEMYAILLLVSKIQQLALKNYKIASGLENINFSTSTEVE